MGSLRDREVACSASDRQGSNFESCVWRTVSSQSSHHPQEVLLAQFSLYVHKGGLKPDSFHFHFWCDLAALLPYIVMCMHRVRSAVRSGRGCVDQSQSFWWWGLSVGVVSIRRVRSRVNSGVAGSGCMSPVS